MVLATDTKHDTDILAINAVSAALAISPIPWTGPVGATRIGLENAKLVINPENGNREGVDLDLVVTSTDKLIPMIEAGANQISEDQMMEAVKMAVSNNKLIVDSIQELVKEIGKDKIVIKKKPIDPAFVSEIEKKAKPMVDDFLDSASKKEGNSLGKLSSLWAKTYKFPK